MGIRLFSSCDSDPISKNNLRPSSTVYGNPDPANFIIEKMESVGKFIIVQVCYPDSTNYEGRKIIVYENIEFIKIVQATKLDPHFCDDKTHMSPIARFEPTNRGWKYATSFCKSIKKSAD